MSTLRQAFDNHDGRLVGKISHFFDDYEPHLARLRRDDLRILEIGIFGGGSLELWQSYFGPSASVHGLDLESAAVKNCPPGATAHHGSQTDADFLHRLVDQHGPFDLIVDDGSHMVDHQITTFETLYPTMSDDGLYICEDAFTSYWEVYGGGLGRPGTFIEYAKAKVDELHAHWFDEPSLPPSDFTDSTRSVTFLSGAVIFERSRRQVPTYEIRVGELHETMSIEDLHEAARRNLGDDTPA